MQVLRGGASSEYLPFPHSLGSACRMLWETNLMARFELSTDAPIRIQDAAVLNRSS